LSFGLSQNIKWHQIRLDSIYTSNFIFLVQIEHFLEHLRITWYSFCHISRSWSPKKTIWNLNLINFNWEWGGIHFKIGSLITKKALGYPEILWFFIRIGISACFDLCFWSQLGWILLGWSTHNHSARLESWKA